MRLRSKYRRFATRRIAAAPAFAMLLARAALATQSPPAAPTFAELMSLKYSGIGVGGAVKLVDGRYEDTGTRRSVTLARGFRITGDLDGDGRDEAAALLAENKGGSGTFEYLAVVGRKGGTPVQLAITPLGDRVQVRDARIEAQRIVVDVVRAGPNDAMCCPGDLATVAWELKRGKLQSVVIGTKTDRLSLAAVAGHEWVLRYWAWNEPVPAGIEITFEVTGDRVAGRAACDRYFATAKLAESPGDLTMEDAGSTKMACPEPQMSAGGRFLTRLAAVRKFSFMAGQLALSWSEGDQVGTMLFERKARKP